MIGRINFRSTQRKLKIKWFKKFFQGIRGKTKTVDIIITTHSPIKEPPKKTRQQEIEETRAARQTALEKIKRERFPSFEKIAKIYEMQFLNSTEYISSYSPIMERLLSNQEIIIKMFGYYNSLSSNFTKPSSDLSIEQRVEKAGKLAAKIFKDKTITGAVFIPKYNWSLGGNEYDIWITREQL